MTTQHLKIRANQTTKELEIEGDAEAVAMYWTKLWPEIGGEKPPAPKSISSLPQPVVGNDALPELFGEFYAEFRSGILDTDKMLVAGAFIQLKDEDRVFTTKGANQLLINQNIKLSNPSEYVRRLIQSKKVFVVSEGKFRVAAIGFDHLETLKQDITPKENQ